MFGFSFLNGSHKNIKLPLKVLSFFLLKKKKEGVIGDFKLTTTSVPSRSPRGRKKQFILWVFALPSQGQPGGWVGVHIPS